MLSKKLSPTLWRRRHTAALLLTTLLVACACGSMRPVPASPVQPEPEIRYLPAAAAGPCLLYPPPKEPDPPEVCPDDIPGCQLDQLFLALLLDHEALLERWARAAWRICGPRGEVAQ